MLTVLLAGFSYAGRFVYVTMIHPQSAFEKPPVTQTPAPPQSFAAAASFSATPTRPLSPEEQLAGQADTDFMKDRVNILLTGIDYAPEREGREDFRTDTILVLCIDFASGKADMLSIPRDSYADIARTNRRWKINGAFMSAGGAEGDGFACMMETVSMALGGIPIDYYAGIEMPAVKAIVDIMGGVWYDVDVEIKLDDRHIGTGYQLLDGQAVLDYCRARKGITSGTDIDRIDRQQRLLLAVFKQLQESAKLTTIPDIYRAVSEEVYTNLSFEQITALALFMNGLDADTSLKRYALRGEYMNIYNASYYVLDHTYTVQVLREIFGENVSLNIDWTYSLEYVKRDAATIALVDAMDALQNYIDKDKELLRLRTLYPNWQALNTRISQARALLATAQDTLAAQNSDAMGSVTKQLKAMLKSLKAFVKESPEPTPVPTSTPIPVQTPTPTKKPAPPPEKTPVPTLVPTEEPTPTPMPEETPLPEPTDTPVSTPTD